ncbi:RNA helicase aquarius [Eumeta japonica]|uniref:RNA helicase aquarius n=1 Tax=Eumeta variegata TaxID=151549 RepID=A0A4C1SIB6_EUMVA|nr:RNA helicase aquarius [Eumeta japonica]
MPFCLETAKEVSKVKSSASNSHSFESRTPEGKEGEAPWHRYDKSFLKELLISRHERRISQLEELNSMPLYPTEEVIWDENVVPTEIYSGESCLALPKLNLQFLTLHDYLLRNFNLFRLESTYEIRQDIGDAIQISTMKMAVYRRMGAGPSIEVSQWEVAKPNIGERALQGPADVTVTLSVRNEIKHEWGSLRKHGLLSHYSSYATYSGRGVRPRLRSRRYVGRDGQSHEGPTKPNCRRPETFRLLDPNQYGLDLDKASRERSHTVVNLLQHKKSGRTVKYHSQKQAKTGPAVVFVENSVLFTPTQIEAIRSGMQPGLTLVVGPPGTATLVVTQQSGTESAVEGGVGRRRATSAASRPRRRAEQTRISPGDLLNE